MSISVLIVSFGLVILGACFGWQLCADRYERRESLKRGRAEAAARAARESDLFDYSDDDGVPCPICPACHAYLDLPSPNGCVGHELPAWERELLYPPSEEDQHG